MGLDAHAYWLTREPQPALIPRVFPFSHFQPSNSIQLFLHQCFHCLQLPYCHALHTDYLVLHYLLSYLGVTMNCIHVWRTITPIKISISTVVGSIVIGSIKHSAIFASVYSSHTISCSPIYCPGSIVLSPIQCSICY